MIYDGFLFGLYIFFSIKQVPSIYEEIFYCMANIYFFFFIVQYLYAYEFNTASVDHFKCFHCGIL